MKPDSHIQGLGSASDKTSITKIWWKFIQKQNIVKRQICNSGQPLEYTLWTKLLEEWITVTWNENVSVLSWSNADKVFSACPWRFSILVYSCFLVLSVFSLEQLVQGKKHYCQPHYCLLLLFLFHVFIMENSKTFLVVQCCAKGKMAQKNTILMCHKLILVDSLIV